VISVAAELDGLDIASFEACEINAEEFSHEAHIFIGWLYLQKTDLSSGMRRFSATLRQLTRKLGVPGKYHETVTWFFMMQIAERCQRIDAGDWCQFKAENPDLFSDAKALLSRYYTPARLASSLAREQFMLPDRLALTSNPDIHPGSLETG